MLLQNLRQLDSPRNLGLMLMGISVLFSVEALRLSVRANHINPAKEIEARLKTLPNGEHVYVGYHLLNDPTFGEGCVQRWIRKANPLPDNFKESFSEGELIKTEMLCPRTAATENTSGLAKMPSGEMVFTGVYTSQYRPNCQWIWARHTHAVNEDFDQDKIVVENNLAAAGGVCSDAVPNFKRPIYFGKNDTSYKVVSP